ncbi:MAG: class I SAM-dependent methyltransferase [Chloroflexota bacterium]
MAQNTPPTPQTEDQTVGDYWSKIFAEEAAFTSKVYWLGIPEVFKRYHEKASNAPNVMWYEHCVRHYLQGKFPVERMLDIGCGAGSLAHELAPVNAYQHYEGWDIAEGAIEGARQLAQQQGMTNVTYRVADANKTPLPPHYYDVVWFNMSLHHVDALENVCKQVAQSLKPDGYLFMAEYVGPNRFDFTQRQKEVIRAAFKLIPMKFRHCFAAGGPEYMLEVGFPDPKAVADADYSEAIRSADILKVLAHDFNIVTINNIGGTILQYLLNNIAGNFRTDDPDSIKVLEMLFDIEDTLIETGDIQSDFVMVVAQPKQ